MAIGEKRRTLVVTASEETPPPKEPIDVISVPLLPSKVFDQRPLPTLVEPQTEEAVADAQAYQSIAASAVLQISLDRSRMRWTHDGIFERYWTKPESGKNARPPPPDNPDTKWMKPRGPCRIRIEPHIFEAEVFIEEKEKIKAVLPAKTYLHSASVGHQIHRQPQHVATAMVPASSPNIAAAAPQASPMVPRPSSMASQPVPAVKTKTSPDPVISMLAARASSDPSLKTLMKEVATGNASQEQLRVFQRHIDELTKILQEREQKQNSTMLHTQALSNASNHPVHNSNNNATTRQEPPRPHPGDSSVYNHAQPWQAPLQPPVPAPPAPAPPVILQFTSPGSTEDRFLFPRYSIVEKLTPQHLLVSYIVTRSGRAALDQLTRPLEWSREYWQPVTFMVEVAYGREELLNCIKRWVKPVDEVKTHMSESMSRFSRAPVSHLAFHLPHKESDDFEVLGRPETESSIAQEPLKKKSRSNVVFIKKKPGTSKAKDGERNTVKSEGTNTSQTEVGRPQRTALST